MGTDTTTGCVAAWSFDNHPSPGIEPASTPPTTHQHPQSRRTTQTISGRGIYLPLRSEAEQHRRCPPGRSRSTPNPATPPHLQTNPNQAENPRFSTTFVLGSHPYTDTHSRTNLLPYARGGVGWYIRRVDTTQHGIASFHRRSTALHDARSHQQEQGTG
jgi:hypothetical protein